MASNDVKLLILGARQLFHKLSSPACTQLPNYSLAYYCHTVSYADWSYQSRATRYDIAIWLIRNFTRILQLPAGQCHEIDTVIYEEMGSLDMAGFSTARNLETFFWEVWYPGYDELRSVLYAPQIVERRSRRRRQVAL